MVLFTVRMFLTIFQPPIFILLRSLPPKPVGLPIGAMLSDIQSFKKDKLKTVEPVPTAVPLPNASSGVVARGKPAPPPKRGSLMADMKTVSLRKTGILQEVCTNSMQYLDVCQFACETSLRNSRVAISAHMIIYVHMFFIYNKTDSCLCSGQAWARRTKHMIGVCPASIQT